MAWGGVNETSIENQERQTTAMSKGDRNTEKKAGNFLSLSNNQTSRKEEERIKKRKRG